jgi:hypothetical protein
VDDNHKLNVDMKWIQESQSLQERRKGKNQPKMDQITALRQTQAESFISVALSTNEELVLNNFMFSYNNAHVKEVTGPV